MSLDRTEKLLSIVVSVIAIIGTLGSLTLWLSSTSSEPSVRAPSGTQESTTPVPSGQKASSEQSAKPDDSELVTIRTTWVMIAGSFLFYLLGLLHEKWESDYTTRGLGCATLVACCCLLLACVIPSAIFILMAIVDYVNHGFAHPTVYYVQLMLLLVAVVIDVGLIARIVTS